MCISKMYVFMYVLVSQICVIKLSMSVVYTIIMCICRQSAGVNITRHSGVLANPLCI